MKLTQITACIVVAISTMLALPATAEVATQSFYADLEVIQVRNLPGCGQSANLIVEVSSPGRKPAKSFVLIYDIYVDGQKDKQSYRETVYHQLKTKGREVYAHRSGTSVTFPQGSKIDVVVTAVLAHDANAKNNTATASVNCQNLRPDIAITSVSIPNAACGQGAKVSVTMVNQGDADANVINLKFSVYINGVLDQVQSYIERVKPLPQTTSGTVDGSRVIKFPVGEKHKIVVEALLPDDDDRSNNHGEVEGECPDALILQGPRDTAVYFGYDPAECRRLDVSVSGGTPGYTYAWSSGETTPSIDVCPSVATDHTVTVTCSFGYTETLTMHTCVVDVRGPVGRDGFETIKMSRDGNNFLQPYETVPTAMSQGAVLGYVEDDRDCDGIAGKTGTFSSSQSRTRLSQIYPNPASNQLTVRWANGQELPLQVQLMDLSGRQMSQTAMTDGEELNLDVSSLPSGIYLLRISSQFEILEEQKVVIAR